MNRKTSPEACLLFVSVGIFALAIVQAQLLSAQAAGFGHTGGGGGGGGSRGGGGGGGRSFSAPSRCGGWSPGYSGGGSTYSTPRPSMPLPTDWAPQTDYVPSVWGYRPRVRPTFAPPFAQPDPMADFYKQQELDSRMSQMISTQSSIVTYPAQSQLPTDFGNPIGRRDGVVTVEQGKLVRDNFHGSGLFTKPWWKNYKNSWFNPAWSDDWVWNAVDWETLVAFWRGTAPKSAGDYEFGSNIVFNEGKVFYGGEPLMSSEEYYHQGQTLAAKGEHLALAKNAKAPHKVPLVKDWAQFGVFSLVSAGEKFSTKILQLAVNRDGKIRGNSYDVMNDQVDRIEGEVDKTNSRVCFTVGKNRTVIYDTGLGNLLSSQSPIVIHLDKDRVQQRALVRLDQSKL